MDQEEEPMINKDVKPCEHKSMRWLCRSMALIFTTIMLISMTLIAWNQYSSFMYEDDRDIPQPIAMLNTCLNTSWNIQKNNDTLFSVLYYESVLTNNELFADTSCDIRLKFPSIQMIGNKCCRLILWKTI